MSIERLSLHTPAALKWTAAQEKTLSRDYPFQEQDPADPALFVQRTYLHFLWLPHSIMPLALLIPSLLRIQASPDLTEDQPHPLHASIEPILLSLRAAASKYHDELPQILADGGGAGEAEEIMMWYALGYEKTNVSTEGSDPSGEDTVMLEDKWRSAWLERMEQREVQIQILLYFLKLSLPGPCTPLPPVEVPPTDSVSFIPPIKPSRLRKRKKEKPMMVTPSSIERLESFMDKLSMWQLVSLMGTSRAENTQKSGHKNERDWMQKFCEDIVEPLFKSKLPEKCTLLRSKIFPNSPFSDEPPSPGPSIAKSLPGSHPDHSSSTASRSAAMKDSRSRSRSLSVSLAQEKEKERAASVGATQDKTLQRALTRQISMSRVWKRKEQSSATVSRTDAKAPAASAKRVIKRTDSQSQPSQSHAAPVITLVTATPVKAKKLDGRAKSNVSGRSSSPIPFSMCRSSSSQPAERSRSSSLRSAGRSSSPHPFGRSSSPLTANSSSLTQFDTEDEESASASVPLCDSDILGNARDEEGDVDEAEAEEIWLPDFSPDVLLLGAGARKRVPSVGSDMMTVDTPVRKRMRLGR